MTHDRIGYHDTVARGRPDPHRDYATEAAVASAHEELTAVSIPDDINRTRTFVPGGTINVKVVRYVWVRRARGESSFVESPTVTIETDIDKIYRESIAGDQVYILGNEVNVQLNVTPVGYTGVRTLNG